MSNAAFMMQMRAQQRMNPVQRAAAARQSARDDYDRTGVIDPSIGRPEKKASEKELEAARKKLF